MIIAVPLMAVIIHVYRQIQDHFLAKKNLSQEENDYVKLTALTRRAVSISGARTNSKSGCFRAGRTRVQ